MRLLLAVDLAEAGVADVVRQGARWAERLGATLDLVYSEGQRYAFEFVTDPEVRRLMEVEANRLRDEDAAALERLLEAISAPSRGAAHRVRGRPADAVLEAAKGYDGLLVATHGRTGLAHFWLGSVAERLVRRARIPVIVLRIPRGS